MPAYFERTDVTRFQPTAFTGGAWNVTEQHVAPPIGLLAHAIEVDHAARSPQPMQLSRLSVDILGVIPIDEVEVTCRVLRPGRSIELVEATLAQAGRPALSARAWLMHTRDTDALAGSAHPAMPPRDAIERADPSSAWPGEFIATVGEVRRRQEAPGRAWTWILPAVPLLEGETVSTTARLVSLIDIANGVTPRADPRDVAFPNLDLTLHLVRQPEDGWIGFDTTVTFGATGLGMTHTVLHDERGVVGSVVQSLTVRPHR
ncbi:MULTISPECIES: thioesterase family protein [Microbacterium]|uniref:thioesterase family protein n=1 Tax=Microbacterium TaxID=33882 RepID=UPI0003805308|nr:MULTISPECIES: thioesterase family protein [unclassified Microbacterium]MDT3345170.1 thioesterase family protein [Microbacterium sp. KSW2-22]